MLRDCRQLRLGYSVLRAVRRLPIWVEDYRPTWNRDSQRPCVGRRFAGAGGAGLASSSNRFAKCSRARLLSRLFCDDGGRFSDAANHRRRAAQAGNDDADPVEAVELAVELLDDVLQ